MSRFHLLLASCLALVVTVAASAAPNPYADPSYRPKTVFAQNGKPVLPIVVGSVAEPAAELKKYLDQIIGAHEGGGFKLVPLDKTNRHQPGIFVGLHSDFHAEVPRSLSESGTEGFQIRSLRNQQMFLTANHARGVSHAVVTLLHDLGCRWYFPGKTWEVIPERQTIAIWCDRQSAPNFPTQRRIWYGYGAYPQSKQEWEDWNRRNRMGSPISIGIGHSWAGLNRERDFKTHPEWFALVEGKRQPTKPCYSHPEVIARAIASAKLQAKAGKAMISMTPPDGLGYCECELCQQVSRASETFVDHHSLFGKTTDGELVNVTSETVFGLVNQVAAAVSKDHPNVLIGCYAYSAYSHPPSFDLHPKVYLQTTTAYRRTPLTLEQQLKAFGDKTTQLGIREYYSVYQWDWDYPDPGKLTPSRLKEDLKFFQKNGVTAINAEASCNWGPRGLGYYLAATYMWNLDVDAKWLLRDFYQNAFGPAALPMQRYYARWYGKEVAVLPDEKGVPEKATYRIKGGHDLAALKAAYRDLNEAARLTKDHPKCRARVDELRLYAHYLLLRHHLQQAAETGEEEKILSAIEAEVKFGARLADTGMIHVRPLVGKALLRRFRQHEEILVKHPVATDRRHPWRQLGKAPDEQELAEMWRKDLATIGLQD